MPSPGTGYGRCACSALVAGAAVLYAGQRNLARTETVRARRQTDLATLRLLAAEAQARTSCPPEFQAGVPP